MPFGTHFLARCYSSFLTEIRLNHRAALADDSVGFEMSMDDPEVKESCPEPQIQGDRSGVTRSLLKNCPQLRTKT